jgi:hypothetical protein
LELDRDRLAKLLNLTGSDHDAEALAAIRKANELLRQSSANWEDALGLSSPPADPTPAAANRPKHASPPPRQSPPARPPGYQLTASYRDAFRREPLIPRLLAFPFWIAIELLAAIRPDKWIDTRGRVLTTVFTLSMMAGIAAWIGLGYAIIFH